MYYAIKQLKLLVLQKKMDIKDELLQEKEQNKTKANQLHKLII